MSKEPVAKPGKDSSYAVLPDGQKIRPLTGKVFCLKLDFPKPEGAVAIPEHLQAPFGRFKTKQPIGYAKILAFGPEVYDLKVGDKVLLHPLNMNPQKFGLVEYYLPRKEAIYGTIEL